MAIIHTWRRMEGKLQFTVILSILILSNYECYLWTVPTNAISTFLTGLNKVFVQILYAFFTGFVFYFFIELNRQNKTKIAILRLISNNVSTISSRIWMVIKHVGDEFHGEQTGYTLSHTDFCELCERITIHETKIKALIYGELTFAKFVVEEVWLVKFNRSY